MVLAREALGHVLWVACLGGGLSGALRAALLLALLASGVLLLALGPQPAQRVAGGAAVALARLDVHAGQCTNGATVTQGWEDCAGWAFLVRIRRTCGSRPLPDGSRELRMEYAVQPRMLAPLELRGTRTLVVRPDGGPRDG